MRSALPTTLVAAMLFAGAASAAQQDDARVLWQAQERAEFAMYALSDRYSAIWATLEQPDKAEFSARERAWLNQGRQAEQRACARERGAPTDAGVLVSCLADVTERRLARLGGGSPALQLGPVHTMNRP